MPDDRIYKIALTMVQNVGHSQAKILLQHFTAEEIFKATLKDFRGIEDLRKNAVDSILHYKDFSLAEEELKFVDKHKIALLFYTDEDYPKRLQNCSDSPILLYYKGTADLNTQKIISIVGTRSITEYGRQITEQFIEDLSAHNVTIVSGMAYGVDGVAHKSAVKNNLPTVGVLAHGLDRIYPTAHKQLAKEIIESGGGLLTELRTKTIPERFYFPARNRIVAGMCDATIVVETDIKGGSMITAEIANSYNLDVFAFPGRTNDRLSKGCNYLIRTNKASLITSAEDLIAMMSWDEKEKTKAKPIQQKLLLNLSEDEKLILHIIENKDKIHIDELVETSGLTSSSVAIAILNLELQNIISAVPGKMYEVR